MYKNSKILFVDTLEYEWKRNRNTENSPDVLFTRSVNGKYNNGNHNNWLLDEA